MSSFVSPTKSFGLDDSNNNNNQISNQQSPQSAPGSTTRAIISVSSYLFFSIALVILSKEVLVESTNALPIPITLTMSHMLISSLLLSLFGFIGERVSLFSFLPPPEFDRDTVKHLFPISFCFAMTALFNNLSLQYIQLSFYQIARSPAILFSTLLNVFVMQNMSFTSDITNLYSVLLVIFGFIIGCLGEPEFSLLGTFFGVLSTVFLSLYAVFVKDAMAVVAGNQWRLYFYTSITSFIMLLPLMVSFNELDLLSIAPQRQANGFWTLIIISAVFSFIVSVSISLMSKHTSKTVLNLSGVFKAILQTLLAIALYNDDFTIWTILALISATTGTYFFMSIRTPQSNSTPILPQQQTQSQQQPNQKHDDV